MVGSHGPSRRYTLEDKRDTTRKSEDWTTPTPSQTRGDDAIEDLDVAEGDADRVKGGARKLGDPCDGGE